LCRDNNKGQELDVSTVRQCQVWVAPPQSFIKINWDAAINSSRGCVGFGSVARNCNGVFLAVKCIVHPQKIEAKLVEALVAFWVIRFCMEMEFREIIFEGDAAQVIDDICSLLPHLSNSGHITESIVHDIYHLTSAKFIHIKREVHKNLSSCWMVQPPACIINLLVRDRLHL